MLAPVETKSEWFKPLCIMALVFGLGGICCDVFSMASLFATEAITGAVANEQLKASLEAQRQFRPWMMLMGGLHIAQSFALALGAGLSLRAVQRHGRILRGALIAGLVLAPLGLVMGLVMQFTTARPIPVPGMPEGFGPAMQWLGVVAGTGWVAVKMTFFAITLRVLRRQLHDSSGTPSPG
jgi:hypothetical protein